MASAQYKTPFDYPNVYTIKASRGLKWRPEQAQALIMRLSGERRILRIVAEYASVKWQIVDVGDSDQEKAIRAAVLSVYPDAIVEKSAYMIDQFKEPFYRAITPFHQMNPYIAPIVYPQDLKHYDPLVPLSNLMGDLLPNERFIYSVFVGRYSEELHKKADDLLRRSGKELIGLHIADFAVHMLGALTKTPNQGIPVQAERYVPELQKVLEEKVNDILYPCYIFLQIDSPDIDRITNFQVGFFSSMYEMRSPLNTLVPFDFPEDKVQFYQGEVRDQIDIERTGSHERFRQFELARTYGQSTPATNLRDQFRCVLNTREVASIWHLPHEEYTALNIERVNTKFTRIPAVLREVKSGLQLGVNLFGGVETPVHMLEENRKAHMVIVGKTEMGKSTLMHRMIKYDIANGRGVALLDPDGTLVNHVLQNSIPKEREGDVVVWDIANTEYPPPLNPLVAPDPQYRNDAAIDLMNIFERLEPKFRGTRMSHDLADILETLMLTPEVTLQHVRRLIDEAEFRDKFIEGLDDDAAWEFWDEIDRMTDSERQGRYYHLSHRLRHLYRGAVLEPIMCHPRSLDFNKLISEKKIILISLNPKKGALVSDEQIDMLGSIIVSRFQMAATTGASQEPFYLYVDEADRFNTTSISEMFKRARKRNIHLVLATQYMDSLAGNLFNSVMANVGAVLTFQCWKNDAKLFEGFMQPEFTAEDLMKLDRHQAAMYMKFQSTQLPAFSLETEAVELIKSDDLENPEARIRARSTEQHTPMSREEIMSWLSEMYPSRRRSRRSKGTEGNGEEAAYHSWGAQTDETEP
jgi:hypothetical protein